ncbi:MAG: NAD(+)/NADH kinase [Chloroflexota bacterium]|nr:NAD(+)/NADH kinase [Chloroflexota bacterium]
MKKVGICFHPQWAAAHGFAQDLKVALESRVAEVWLSAAWDDEGARRNVEGTDLLICVGGDGTMLWAARLVILHPILLLGINMGRLGFLAELGAEEALARLPQILEGGFRVEERTMLHAEFLPSPGASARKGKRYHALNDVVVGRGAPGRAACVEARLDGRRLALYRTDAVIVATATGSTGYTLSAGGPILHPEARELVLMPVAPHLAAARALVLPSSAVIELRVTADHGAILSVDGQVNKELADGEGVRVFPSSHLARFLRLSSPFDYYTALSERLGWLNAANPLRPTRAADEGDFSG